MTTRLQRWAQARILAEQCAKAHPEDEHLAALLKVLSGELFFDAPRGRLRAAPPPSQLTIEQLVLELVTVCTDSYPGQAPDGQGYATIVKSCSIVAMAWAALHGEIGGHSPQTVLTLLHSIIEMEFENVRNSQIIVLDEHTVH